MVYKKYKRSKKPSTIKDDTAWIMPLFVDILRFANNTSLVGYRHGLRTVPALVLLFIPSSTNICLEIKNKKAIIEKLQCNKIRSNFFLFFMIV